MIAGIAKVKDEADVIQVIVRHMLDQVDHVLVADNASSDGTREILEALPVELIDIPDVAHYQGRHMTDLTARAAGRGAEWVVPFDADEFIYSPFGRLADVIAAHGADIYPVGIYEHRSTASDPDEPNPLRRMGWRTRELSPLHKVACRTSIPVRLAEGNHQAVYEPSIVWEQLIMRHYPYRSLEQFISKVRNGYAGRRATDLPEDQSVHLRELGALLEQEGEEGLERKFYADFWVETPESDPELIFDPAPL